MPPEWHPPHAIGFWTDTPEGGETRHVTWPLGSPNGSEPPLSAHHATSISNWLEASPHHFTVTPHVPSCDVSLWLRRETLSCTWDQTTGGQPHMGDSESPAGTSDVETITTTMTRRTLRRAEPPSHPPPSHQSIPLVHSLSLCLPSVSRRDSAGISTESLVGVGPCPLRRRTHRHVRTTRLDTFSRSMALCDGTFLFAVFQLPTAEASMYIPMSLRIGLPSLARDHLPVMPHVRPRPK